MNPQQNRTGRVLGLLLLVAVLGSQGAAIDLNSSTSLRYFPDNNLEFQVRTDGTIQPQGDIELDGNNIDTSGNTITLRDSTNTQDILRAQEGGNLEIPNGKLNFGSDSGYITGSNGAKQNLVFEDPGESKIFWINDGGPIKLSSGINWEYTKNPGAQTFLDIPVTSGAAAGSEASYSFAIDGTNLLQVHAESDGGGGIQNPSVNIPNGNLDVSGNNITNVDTLKFEEGTSIDGDLTVNGSTDITGKLNLSGDINLSDNNLLDANKVEANRIIDPEDEQINIDDNINLQNNQNIRSSGTNAITLDNNQNIGIPNGNLTINEQSRVKIGAVEISENSASYARFKLNGESLIGYRPSVVTIFDNVNLRQNTLKEVQILKPKGSRGKAIKIRDSTTSNNLATFENRGPIRLRNSVADEDVLRVNASGGSNVEIPNGNIDAQGNRIVDTTGSDTVRVGDADSNKVSIDAGGSGETVVSSGDGGSGSTERLRVTSSGGEADVDVSNSDVDLQGNSVTSSGGEVCIGDQCA